jgi:hypothetical protein
MGLVGNTNFTLWKMRKLCHFIYWLKACLPFSLETQHELRQVCGKWSTLSGNDLEGRRCYNPCQTINSSHIQLTQPTPISNPSYFIEPLFGSSKQLLALITSDHFVTPCTSSYRLETPSTTPKRSSNHLRGHFEPAWSISQPYQPALTQKGLSSKPPATMFNLLQQSPTISNSLKPPSATSNQQPSTFQPPPPPHSFQFSRPSKHNGTPLVTSAHRLSRITSGNVVTPSTTSNHHEQPWNTSRTT